jgi:hypothetical protein
MWGSPKGILNRKFGILAWMPTDRYHDTGTKTDMKTNGTK